MQHTFFFGGELLINFYFEEKKSNLIRKVNYYPFKWFYNKNIKLDLRVGEMFSSLPLNKLFGIIKRLPFCLYIFCC